MRTILFPVLHEYFEVVYGPLIGASSMFLARTLARHIDAAGSEVTVSPTELAREVGLRSSSNQPVGKTSPLAKALDRLAHHRLAQPFAPATLGVATAVPPATPRLLAPAPGDHPPPTRGVSGAGGEAAFGLSGWLSDTAGARDHRPELRRGLSMFLDCAAVGETVDSDDLVSAAEVAAILRLSHPSSVTTYLHRYPDFPRPVVDLSASRVRLWRRQDIQRWHRNRTKP